MAASKRRYESPLRKEQALATRRRIADSARRLFAERGYGGTTIEAIARDAGVAPQTFYGIFGSKRAVLFELLDAVALDADAPALGQQLAAAAGDAHEQLRLLVDFRVRLFTQAADFLDVVRGARAVEPDLAATWEEGEERRRRAQAQLVRDWARTSQLRSGVTQKEAADVLWALTGPDVHRLFVTELRWPIARYRDWLTAHLRDAILHGGGTSRRRQ
jgi:AcrR family transcriptional regulator